MRYFLTIFFLLGISSVSADEKTMLYDFRYWTAPDHTRIVVDTQENAFYDIVTSKDYIILSVENAKVLSETFAHLFFEDRRIERAQIKRDHETLKLIFHTKDLYNVKYFNLPPNQKYKYHRLVIDLYDSKSSKSKTKLAIEKSTKKDKTIIVVDAGHGGEDSGAVGKNKTREKDVNLAIAKKLVNTINKNKDLSAILTRRGDYYIPLTKRITIAQNEQATMFISIHADAIESTSAKGASIYTLSEKGNNSKLAKQLENSENSVDQFGGVETVIDSDQFLKSILTDFSRQDREIQSQKLASQVLEELSKIGPVHKKTPQKANFVVLKAPTIPSILVETAFISNPTQERRLGNSKEQQKIADAIYKGVINYFKNDKDNL
ncbi:MAG: N-acetylmuramoyl-L-alanine amidase [Gammaproteobacteria bacterium]|nr:N-acetylmuramoyl-L-alanine amidase [Gammaproteobacteria bacterium]